MSICKYCNNIIESHDIIQIHEHLKKIPGVLNVGVDTCQVCLIPMYKHNKEKLTTCLNLSSSDSFAGMKKYCDECTYETLVIPVNHSKCSGCGGIYKIKLDYNKPEEKSKEKEEKSKEKLNHTSSLMDWWLDMGMR